jgi:hypothetical protein
MAKSMKKNYRFTGKEGAVMSDTLLQKWIQRHQDHHEVRGHFFGKDILANTLSQPGCMGIRFYHAIDDKGQKTLVLVGTDEKGKNLWSSNKVSGGKLKDGPPTGGGDGSWPCPPYC